MRYLSVCSGIEAATVAWHSLGWTAAAFSEIEAFPRAVLSHRYPDVPLHGDFTTIGADEYGAIDLLVGGTPCQSFSVAGLRGGIHDERGNLALEFLRLLDRKRPRWVVWENVPGVFSAGSHDAPDPCPPAIDLDASDGPQDGEEVVVEDSYDADESHAFACFLAGLSELGYGFAYRVLDAQYAGVPQRRRRVFVVGHLGDWRRAAAVLFERHSLSGHPAPRREKGQRTAGTLKACAGKSGTPNGAEEADRLIYAEETANCLQTTCDDYSRADGFNMVAHSLRAEGFDASEDGTGRGTPLVPVSYALGSHAGAADGDQTNRSHESGGPVGSNISEECAYSLRGGRTQAVAFDLRGREDGAQMEGPHDTANIRASSGGSSRSYVAFAQNQRDELRTMDVAGAIAAEPGMKQQTYVVASAVRRLTPRECERLQGFPEIHRELRIFVCQSEDEKNARVRSAEAASAALSLGQNAPVAVNVLIDLERSAVQLHSLGRSPWSASIADLASSSRLPIIADAFARLLALMHDAVGRSTQSGRAASLASINGSSHHLNGSVSALLCGREIDELASDAGRFTAALSHCLKSTTSEAGRTSPNCGSSLQTLACCVSAAISGFIPAAIRDACSYEIRLTAHCGYTAIPYRGKPAADGPRYKALGNSMAVPVMRWIGERIAAVEALDAKAEAA